MTLTFQTSAGVIAGLISFTAFLPYAWDTVRGTARPNRATWVIWTVVGSILFASYSAAAGGPARWVPLSDALGPALMAVLSIRYGEGGWRRLDAGCLTLAGLSLIGWTLTGSPMLSLGVNLLLDLLGALPTVRNAFHHPADEPPFVWRLFFLGNVLNLLAIDHWGWHSAAYPLYVVLVSGLVNALICRPVAARKAGRPSLCNRSVQSAAK